MKVCFETFGCRLNRAEALEREVELLAQGWERTEKHAEADLFVIRGCSVTRRAQRDCEKLIERLKRHHPGKRILVEGCLKTNKPKFHRKHDILDPANSPQSAADVRQLPVPTRTARAYLKVQDGCSGKCTFCIVPQFRGNSVSVPFSDCLDKARRFIDAGYHELVVTGCNLALYASEGKRLPELLDALANLSPTCRVRLGSVEPGNCAEEVVSAMAENANICRFLHLPIQSGSNSILTAMRRPYKVKDVDALVKKAVRLMPRIGLGCDIMTGFPGETDVDFFATQGLLKRHPFSKVHVFPYSERPDTLAAGLPLAIPREIRHARARKLSVEMDSKRRLLAKTYIGTDVDVLIEDEKNLSGWTGEYFACSITNKTHLAAFHRKDLVRVHVMNALHGQLKAVPCHS